jgi:arylsulfatase A-like enzyme
MTIDASLSERWRYGAWRSVGFGLVAGAMEACWLAAATQLPLSVPEVLVLALVAVLVMGFAGLVAGIVSGVVHVFTMAWDASRGVALQMSGTVLLLTGWYLLQSALKLYLERQQILPSVALALMPIGFAGVAYFNARYWLRRVEIGVQYRLSWVGIGAIVSAVLAVIASLGHQLRDTGGSGALSGDRNVLLVTIDTLRRDHVGAYGDPHAAPTPRMDALAAEGILYLDAVTPMPETAPSHASMMTGKHPLRHGVLSNGHELRGSHETVAEVLAREGYATAAFVSSFAVHSRTGLAQGFRVFDDDLSPVPGVGQINAVEWVLRLWMAFGDPASTPWLLERGGQQTEARFSEWLDDHADVPFFAWVHFFEPHAPYEPWGLAGFDNGTPDQPKVDHRAKLALGPEAAYTDDERRVLEATYREEVAYVDGLVGQILDQLDAHGIADETLVIVTADHGEMLGEHGLDYVHHGLWDETLRVPLIIRAPGTEVLVPKVAAQVRVYDLAPTILDFVGLQNEFGEGVDLVAYGENARVRGLWLSLVGRRERAFSEGALLGMRNNMVKYIKDIVTGREFVFNLNDDPGEAADISGGQPEVVEQVRGMLASDEASFLKQVEVEPGKVSADEAAMLEAMGYTE